MTLLRAVVLVAMAFLLAPWLWAETSYEARHDLENSFKQRFGETSRRTWSHGDTLRTLIGRTRAITFGAGTPAVVLDALRPYLGTPEPSLVLARRVDTRDAVHYEFTQAIAGATVENASLIVDVTHDDAIIGVSNRAEPGLKRLHLGAQLSIAAAQCFAAADFLQTVSNCDLPPPEGPQMPGGAGYLRFKVSPVLYAVPPWARPAFAVELTSVSPLVSRRYVVDARGGFILERRDRVHAFEGHGFVFNPNPFTDSAVHNMNDLQPSSPAYENVPLPRIVRPTTGDVFLRGDYVFLKNDVKSTDGNFTQKRGVVDFAAAMAYFHIDAIQNYVQRLGFNDIANRPIEVDVEAFAGANAFYNNTPEGCGDLQFSVRDDGFFAAEDGDVIAHEYGHALQSSQALGKYDKHGGETRAMFEGFGDYWAMSYFDRINGTHHFDPQCLGEWMRRSAGAFTDCRRTVDLGATTKAFDSTKGAHFNATIWTAALWKIHETIGGHDADEIILKSHLSVPDGPSFAEGARAIFTADQALNGGLHSSELCAIFVDRGILKKPDCKPLP